MKQHPNQSSSRHLQRFRPKVAKTAPKTTVPLTVELVAASSGAIQTQSCETDSTNRYFPSRTVLHLAGSASVPTQSGRNPLPDDHFPSRTITALLLPLTHNYHTAPSPQRFALPLRLLRLAPPTTHELEEISALFLQHTNLARNLKMYRSR